MDKIRSWNGPAILSYGFRPFFLLAGLWALIAMLIWLFVLLGVSSIHLHFDPFSWHAHEFVFGYTSAVIAGFLLTAVPNWTGRLPVVGWPLAALAVIWLAGRLVLIAPVAIDPLYAALIDLAFGVALIFFLGREIVAGKNWRNLPVLGILTLFTIANGVFHWNAALNFVANDNYGLRIGIAAEVMLISLIGGRIIPSFTRNWLAQRGSKILPSPVNRFDYISMILNGLALVFFVMLPQNYVTSVLCVFAGFYNFVRLSRWQGQRTLSEPLLWVLHAGFLAIVLGFFAVALAAAGVMPMAGALHIWMVGGIGLMTLAVMTRATRGHTNRPLTAPVSTSAIYVLLILSMVARYAAAVFEAEAAIIWTVAALCWIAAFLLFVLLYGPMHLRASVRR